MSLDRWKGVVSCGSGSGGGGGGDDETAGPRRRRSTPVSGDFGPEYAPECALALAAIKRDEGQWVLTRLCHKYRRSRDLDDYLERGVTLRP